MNDDPCEGCLTYIKKLKDKVVQCIKIRIDTSDGCPCQSCIVKTTCNVTCDKWKIWL